MNSGCYDNDVSKVLVSLTAIKKSNLSVIEIKREDIKFCYRGTNLSNDLIIISAKFKGQIRDQAEIEIKQSNLIEKKKLSNYGIDMYHIYITSYLKEDSSCCFLNSAGNSKFSKFKWGIFLVVGA